MNEDKMAKEDDMNMARMPLPQRAKAALKRKRSEKHLAHGPLIHEGLNQMGQTKLERQAQEIVPGLWLGERWACSYAREAGFRTICVLESRCVQGCFHAPILAVDSGVILNDPETQLTNAEYGGFVRCEGHLLKTAHRVIDKFLKTGPVLVHCLAGTERSPLVVATWLCERHGLVLREAYDLILKKRPTVEKRTLWLGDAERDRYEGTHRN